MSDLTQISGLLAIELDPEQPPQRLCLDREAADRLVDGVAQDLVRLVPEVGAASLVLGGALLDPAQVLRPGFPVFAELTEFYLSSQRGSLFQPRVMAIGADSDGRMPSERLQPERALLGGPLVCMPWVLLAPAELAATLGRACEEAFLDRGEAGAGTQWALSHPLGARLTHARHLSLHDLAAMTAMQLGHAGLQAAWDVIEAALFEPSREVCAPLAPGIDCRWSNGAADLAFDAEAYAQANATLDEWARGLIPSRQLLALWEAHALSLRSSPVGDCLWIDSAGEYRNAAGLLRLEHPALGVAALQAVDARGNVLPAWCLPLTREALQRERAAHADAGAAGLALIQGRPAMADSRNRMDA